MRPIKLTMSAFGPYAGETVINMDELGNAGLYLITGDTGAGKTTIFDAVVFALYGEASGALRDSSMLRSKYASAASPTFIKLEFSHNGGIYTVMRNPEYARPKTRGEGFTSEKAAAELTLPDGSVVTKTGEVTEKITEILGVDRSQFTQIVMLAQGDFLKLLVASTKEREVIFRQIFKTSLYARAQELLKAEALSLDGEYRAAAEDIKKEAANISCPPEYAEYADAEGLKSGFASYSGAEEIIAAILDRDTKLKNEIKKSLDALEKETERLNKALGRAGERDKARSDMAAAQEFISENKDELDKLKAGYEDTLEYNSETERLAYEIRRRGEGLKEYERLDDVTAEIKTLADESEKADGDTKAKRAAAENSAEAIRRIKSELETLRGTSERVFELKLSEKEKRDRLKSVSELDKLLGDTKMAGRKYERDARNYRMASADCAEKADKYNAAYRAFLDEQAGIIAQELAENKPCPVCGSLSHPSPAKLTEKAVTESKLNMLKSEYDASRETAEELSRAAGQSRAAFDAAQSAAEKMKAELFGEIDADIDAVKKELKKELTELKEKIATESENDARRTRLEKELPDAEKAAETMNMELAELEKAAVSANERLTAAKQRQKELSEGLQFSSKAEAQRDIDALQKRHDELKSAQESARKNYEDFLKQMDERAMQIKTLERQLADGEDEDVEKLSAELEKTEEERRELSDKAEKVSVRINVNERAARGIREKIKAVQKTEKRLALIKNLSDTANGQLAGREKITFETYVQMTYFDRIIARANIRFLEMSGGQYELKRRETGDRARKSGLELNVIDHYNGTERDVKTLSGGESFKASLSLALGLSDEIQQTSGGIKLDTMFVDEGFGSLDEESLSQAMNALSGLTEGSRLVGIISHVNELKNRIDKKIIVTKSRGSGSTARIEV